MIKPAIFAEVADRLAVDDFFLPAHREVFEAMCRLDKRGDAIDLVTLADELRRVGMINRLDGGEAYLLEVYGAVPTAENAGHYVRLVKDKATARRLIALLREAETRAYALEDPIEDIVADYASRLAAIETRSDDGPKRLGDEILCDGGIMDTIEKRADPETRAAFFVPTHMQRFNRSVGGLAAERLIIVAAGPGGGKTAFALNLADAAAVDHKIPTLYISAEMGLQQLAERNLGSASGVETRNIHRGNLTRDDWDRLHPAAKRLLDAPFWVYDRPSDIGKICAEIRRFAAARRTAAPPREEGAPEQMLLVVVDYIQLIKQDMRAKHVSLAEAIGEVSGNLKRLARGLKFPIVALSQLTRESRKARTIDDQPKPPDLADLRGSGDLEQDADMVIFLHPHEVPDARPGDAPILVSNADVIVAKNRDGAPGVIPAEWDRRTMTYRDRSPSAGGDSRLPDDDRDF